MILGAKLTHRPLRGAGLHHSVALLAGCRSQALGAGRLYLLDLLLDEAKSVHVVPELGQRVPGMVTPSGVRKAFNKLAPDRGSAGSRECQDGRD